MADAIHDLTAAYALDALDVAERDAFEAHLQGCADCRAEVEGFRDVSSALAYGAGGPQPPPQLRSRIIERAREERTNVLPFRRRIAVPAFAAATAVAALVALGIAVWAGSLSRELDRTRAAAAARDQALAVLADPAARRVPLTTPHGAVVVSPAGRAALVLVDVEPAPPGKTYEIWVIEDGEPRRAGLFDGAPTRTVVPVARPVSAGAIVAVTLEDEGGVDAPQGPSVTSSPEL
jgi:anti-sigma-K factor RskA